MYVCLCTYVHMLLIGNLLGKSVNSYKLITEEHKIFKVRRKQVKSWSM